MIDNESNQRKFENTIQLIGKATSALLDKPMREDHEIGCTCYTCKARRDFVVKKISTGMIKSPYSQYDLIDPKTGDPNEMILLLCPYRVFGFGLRSKDWSRSLLCIMKFLLIRAKKRLTSTTYAP